tara:strand:- start:520 stop:744 length:225 start_codon:yes stop_codon:yes gene_type:complete
LAAVWQFQAEHSRQSVSGFGRHLGVQVAGQSGALIRVFCQFGVLVPSAIGLAGATYREWAFSLGAAIKCRVTGI